MVTRGSYIGKVVLLFGFKWFYTDQTKRFKKQKKFKRRNNPFIFIITQVLNEKNHSVSTATLSAALT